MEINVPTFERDDTRGQVGIETLIVFIAMILVAAIAASVLINTAGFLQNQASETSQDSEDQVSNQVLIISSIGEIDAQLTVDTEDDVEFEYDDGEEELIYSEDNDLELDPDDGTLTVEFDSGDTDTDPVEFEETVEPGDTFDLNSEDFFDGDFDDSETDAELEIVWSPDASDETDEIDDEYVWILEESLDDGDSEPVDVDFVDERDNQIGEVSLTVMQSPGADEIDLAGASIEYIGPDGQETLSFSDDPEVGEYGVEGTQDPDDTSPVLTQREDRFTVTIDLEEDGDDMRNLEEGEESTIRINTQAGSEAVTIVNVPQSISSFDDGDAVEL